MMTRLEQIRILRKKAIFLHEAMLEYRESFEETDEQDAEMLEEFTQLEIASRLLERFMELEYEKERSKMCQEKSSAQTKTEK